MIGKLILSALLILMLIHPVSGILNPIDKGAEMIETGIDNFLIGIADDLYGAGNSMAPTNSSTTNAIFSIATFTYDPWELQVVNDMNIISAFIFLIVIILYVLFGAVIVIIQRFKPQQYEILAHMLNEKGGSFAYKNYLMNNIIAILIIMFGYFGVKYALELNNVLSSLVMLNVLDSIAPTSDNVILYLAMAIFYFILCIFFAWRTLIIGLMAAFALVVGALYVVSWTRSIAVMVIHYFLAMTFMQVVIVGITTVGVLIIQGLKGIGWIALAGEEIVYYLALLILLFLVALLIVCAPLLQFILRVVVRRTF